MKKLIFLINIFLFSVCCNTETAPDCIQSSGSEAVMEITVAPFEEIIVYERVKLFIEQGDQYKVTIKTGKNLMNEVAVEVENGRLSVRNENVCNLFRDYEITKVYVTTPTLNWLQNSSGSAVESIGTLGFPEMWLRSFNQEKDPDIYTNGDFILDINIQNLRITNDNISNYFLTGKAQVVDVFFASGDGRLEAENLIAQHYDVFHRGTNKLIVNPQESIQGDIFGFGDIVSKNTPPVVEVKEHYTGRLIFE